MMLKSQASTAALKPEDHSQPDKRRGGHLGRPSDARNIPPAAEAGAVATRSRGLGGLCSGLETAGVPGQPGSMQRSCPYPGARTSRAQLNSQDRSKNNLKQAGNALKQAVGGR